MRACGAASTGRTGRVRQRQAVGRRFRRRAGDWEYVVSGQDSSCGLRAFGKLFCWGGNSFGNLGLGDTQPRLTPTAVVPERLWKQIAIDTFHACGTDAEQNLYCWGRGIEGQLGTADNAERLAPDLIRAGRGLRPGSRRSHVQLRRTGGRSRALYRGKRIGPAWPGRQRPA